MEKVWEDTERDTIMTEAGIIPKRRYTSKRRYTLEIKVYLLFWFKKRVIK